MKDIDREDFFWFLFGVMIMAVLLYVVVDIINA